MSYQYMQNDENNGVVFLWKKDNWMKFKKKNKMGLFIR